MRKIGWPTLCRCLTCTFRRDRFYGMVSARSCLGPTQPTRCAPCTLSGILELLIPEFHGIDALVIRDSYHRYTVDEHTFLVIDNVHALRQPHEPWERRFATLLAEIDRLDLFFLALLMHDTGKARRTGDTRCRA